MTESQFDEHWSFIGLIVTNLLLLPPICVYLLLNYWRRINERTSYFAGHESKLVLLHGSMAVCFITVYLPIHMILFETRVDDNNIVDSWWEIGSLFSMQSTVFISIWLRCFQPLYDCYVRHSMARKGWKLVLFEGCCGSPRMMCLFVLIIPNLTFWAIFYVAVSQAKHLDVDVDTGAYVLGLPFLILYIFQVTLLVLMLAVIIKTWNNVHNKASIREELVIQCIVLTMTIVLQFGVFPFDALQRDGGNERYYQMRYFSYFVLATIDSFCSIVVSTQFVAIMAQLDSEHKKSVVKEERAERQRSINFKRPSLAASLSMHSWVDIKSSEYIEYGFGKEVLYHEHSPGFKSMKQELLENDISRISERSWNEVMKTAQEYLRTKWVVTDYVDVHRRIRFFRSKHISRLLLPHLPPSEQTNDQMDQSEHFEPTLEKVSAAPVQVIRGRRKNSMSCKQRNKLMRNRMSRKSRRRKYHSV